MYFDVPDILIATSDNLVDWTPLADSAGKLVKVLTPRRGYFDAWLVEAGPPAIITPHGILLMYNAGNSGQYGDRKSTRLNSSHGYISYAVFCLKKKNLWGRSPYH